MISEPEMPEGPTWPEALAFGTLAWLVFGLMVNYAPRFADWLRSW